MVAVPLKKAALCLNSWQTVKQAIHFFFFFRFCRHLVTSDSSTQPLIATRLQSLSPSPISRLCLNFAITATHLSFPSPPLSLSSRHTC